MPCPFAPSQQPLFVILQLASCLALSSIPAAVILVLASVIYVDSRHRGQGCRAAYVTYGKNPTLCTSTNQSIALLLPLECSRDRSLRGDPTLLIVRGTITGTQYQRLKSNIKRGSEGWPHDLTVGDCAYAWEHTAEYDRHCAGRHASRFTTLFLHFVR